MPRRVIGHDHMCVPDLLQGLHVPMHIHHAFIGPDFLEFVAATLDIAEVAEEDLLPLAKVTDDIGHLIAGIRHAFRHTSKAEIDTVIRAWAYLDKSFEAFSTAKHSIYPSISGRQPRIAGMASHSDLILRRDGNDALQKIGDSRPVCFCGYWITESRFMFVGGIEVPGAVG